MLYKYIYCYTMVTIGLTEVVSVNPAVEGEQNMSVYDGDFAIWNYS